MYTYSHRLQSRGTCSYFYSIMPFFGIYKGKYMNTKLCVKQIYKSGRWFNKQNNLAFNITLTKLVKFKHVSFSAMTVYVP